MPSPIKFTADDLKDIIEPLAQFALSTITYYKIKPQIDIPFIKSCPHYFTVLVNDGITRKDRKFNPKTDFLGGIDYSNTVMANALKAGESFEDIKKRLAYCVQNGHFFCGEYNGLNAEFFPFPNQKAKNCRVFLANNLILKSTVQSDKTLMDYVRSNIDFAHELIRKTALATAFALNHPHTCTQKSMDEFIWNQEIQTVHKRLKTIRNIPFMHAVENLRHLLFDTLVKHHWQQIAPSEEEAKKALKANKKDIYVWAEKLGYIPNANRMIIYYDQRNSLAHPDALYYPILPESETHILKDFEAVLTNLTHSKNLTFSLVADKDAPQNPLYKIMADLYPENVTAYALIERVDAFSNLIKDYTVPKQANGKPLKPRKVLEFLATLGVLNQGDVQPVEDATKIRNGFAHGQSNAPDVTKIMSAFQNMDTILASVYNHHYNNIRN